MKPATRSTLFRVVLAIHLFDAGMVTAARYALPRKYKIRYEHPFRYWQMRKLVPIMLETLRNNLVAARLINRDFNSAFSKIGDTISVRKPTGYMQGAA